METVSILSLPPELLHAVFCSLNIEDVTNLAGASRTLREVRNANAHSIYLAVAPNSIQCFSDAQALLRAIEQEDAGAVLPTMAEKNRAARIRMRRLVDNSRMVLKACEFFEKYPCNYLINPTKARRCCRGLPVLSPSERHRFIHAYYRIWTFAESPLLEVSALAAATRLRELLLLRDIGAWTTSLLDQESAALLGYIREDWMPMFEKVTEQFDDKMSRVTGRPIGPSYTPCNVYAVFDEFQHELDARY